MICNKLILQSAACVLFYFAIATGYSQSGDFKIQHIQDNIGNLGGVNNTFSPVSSLNNAFVLANNNRKTHAGRSDLNSGHLEGDDMAGARRLTDVGELSYYRENESSSNNMRFNSSIWEYVGPVGGCNEMIVRGRYAVSLNGGTNSVTQSLSGVVDANKCIPFITGIMNNDSENGADSGTAIAYLEDSTTLRVQKGTTSNNVTVYITLVEFTGSNWTVLHGDSGNKNNVSGTITLRSGSDGNGTQTDVSDWSEAIIFSQFRGDTGASGGDYEGLSDLWPVIDPGSNNRRVDWTFDSEHTSLGVSNRHFVHVLNNPFLAVSRFQDNSNNTGESTLDITSAGVSNINEALIIGSSTSSGKGTAYGRGWRNYYLKSTTQAAHWAHRSGNNMAHEIQIVDLSGLSTQDIAVVDSASNIISDGRIDSPSTTNDTDFGNVLVSSSVTKTYTIENNGCFDLTISSITSSHSSFVISSIPTTIAGNSSEMFDLTFTPTSAQLFNAEIKISSNSIIPTKKAYTFTVKGLGDISYCASSGNTDFATGITQVVFNTINNSDGIGKDNGYEDFTSISTSVVIGNSYDLSVNVNSGLFMIWIFPFHNDITTTIAWIDWNQDGDFDDTGEEFLLGSIGNTNNSLTPNSPLSITVPATAVPGATRMRISTRYQNNPTSCLTNFDGEVEDYTINIVCSSNEWTGADNDDWNNELNWSCNQIPTDVSEILIPSSITPFPVIYESDNFGTVENLEIESGASLTIIDNSIEISGNLLLNGLINLQGEGQLIQTEGSILDAASSGFLERDQQGTADTYSYNYWSSPVGINKESADVAISDYSYTLDDVLYDGINKVNFVSGKDGSNSNPISISEYWIYTYVNKSGDYSEWDQVGSSGIINTGVGYTMKGPGSGAVTDFQNYTFIGKPNNGDISLTISNGYDYLVGNPYPSAIDADQFIVDNGPTIEGDGPAIDGTLYFWEHWGGGSHKLADYQGGYATYNLSGGVGNASKAPEDGASKVPLRFIPVAQGFFVKAEADGSIVFKNSQRVFEMESDGGSIFMKEESSKKTIASKSTSKDTRSKIRLGFEAPEIGHRQILLTIDDRATANVDWGFDGKKLDNLEQDMYWDLDANKYIIQALPNVNIGVEVPIGISMGKEGVATIKIDTLENISDDLELYIKDALTGLTHQINNIPFEIELEAGEYLNRFSLVFKAEETLSIANEILEEGVIIFMDNNQSQLKIRNTINKELNGVYLYNSLGQLLNSWKSDINKPNLNLSIYNKPVGVYIVQIKTKEGIISKKIIIK